MRRTQLVRRSWGTLAACVVGFVALWLVFIHSAQGQRIDLLVQASRTVEPAGGRQLNLETLRAITVVSLAAGLILIVVAGGTRKRWALGLVAAGLVLGAAVSAELLKQVIIHRPELTPLGPGDQPTNSFPSGHSTISTALSLAVLMIVPSTWRRLAAIGVGLFTGFQVAGVVAAGWHRPSDAITGCLIALSWGCLGVIVLVAIDRVRPADDGREAAELVIWPLGLLLLLSAGFFVALFAQGSPDWNNGSRDYVGAIVILIAVGVAAVWWFWRLISGWTLGLPLAPVLSATAPTPESP